MAKCRFCGKRFPSPQAVRGHLQWCPRYHGGREPKAQSSVKAERPKARPAYIGSEPRAGGIAESALDELQAERAKLDLRRVKAEQRRLDEEEAERARRRREERDAEIAQAAAEAEARERARLEAEAQAKREQEAAREKRKQEGREALAQIGQELQEITRRSQEITRRSMEKTSQTFAQVLADMTKALTPPPPSPEEEARKREREEAERREARKRELVAYGERYADEELDAEGVRPGPELIRIYQRIRPALERLQGTETKARVEALVDRVLDAELGEN